MRCDVLRLSMGAGLMACLLAGASAGASTLATDQAANYTTGSFSGLNQGSGFGAWSTNFAYTGPTGEAGGGGSFVGTNSGITASTPAFDIYVYPSASGDTGLNTDIETATRSFTGALAPGQTFATDFNLNNGNQNTALANTSPSTADSNLGFALLDSGGKVLFSLTAFGGGEYWATDATNSGAYFEPASGNILYNYHLDDNFVFNLLNSAGDYSLTATGSIGGAPTATFNGSINMATGGPTQVEYFNNNGGNGSDVQWSSMSISTTPTPEPASLAGALFAFAGLALLSRRRRRL